MNATCERLLCRLLGPFGVRPRPGVGEGEERGGAFACDLEDGRKLFFFFLSIFPSHGFLICSRPFSFLPSPLCFFALSSPQPVPFPTKPSWRLGHYSWEPRLLRGPPAGFGFFSSFFYLAPSSFLLSLPTSSGHLKRAAPRVVGILTVVGVPALRRVAVAVAFNEFFFFFSLQFFFSFA